MGDAVCALDTVLLDKVLIKDVEPGGDSVSLGEADSGETAAEVGDAA